MSYTLRQASELTGLSTKTLRRKIASGEIEATKQMGKYGEEYIIEHIPDSLLPADKVTTGQPSGETVATSHTLGKSDLSESEPPLEKPDQDNAQANAKAVARDQALFAELFASPSIGQKMDKPGEKDPENKKQENAEANASGSNPATSTGHKDGQGHTQYLDMNATLHELLKLVRKLQEENATLHEKIGELNATVQLLSSGRMLPMSIPPVSPAEQKNWWRKLAFWRG